MADVKLLRIGFNHFQLGISAVSFQNHTVDASNEGTAYVFQVPSASAITGFRHRYGVRTGTPPTYVATIESLVVTTGLPDGTDVGGGSPTAKTFTPPADATWDGLFQEVTFTNSYTPSVGQLVCVTIRYSSGTIDGSNNSSFQRNINNFAMFSADMPYPLTNSAGTWSKYNSGGYPAVALVTAAGNIGTPLLSFYTTSSASTVGHRHAVKFTLPGTGTTYKLRGIRFAGAIANGASKAPILGLWSASSLLQDITLDSDVGGAPITSRSVRDYFFNESSLATLTGGTTYYVGLEVADAANGQVELEGCQLASAADGGCYPGGQNNFHLATYDGAAWSDDKTVRPVGELILEDVTEPAGGSGGVIGGPNMRAGMMA